MWWQKLALLSVLVIICVVRGNPLYNNPKFLLDEPTSYRLPKNSVPISYEIILKPNIEADDFAIEGQVNIKIRIVEDTDKITIHSRDLLITKIEIFNASSSDLIISDASFDPVTTHDFIVIDLEKTYGSGTELRIDITYNGELRNDGAGFYRGSYNNSQGETKFYGATQFEILDARSAFPCYDEPGIRAVMTLTIIHDVSLTAIANMEESSKTLSSDETKYITQFQPTPPMQTYLLAFLVSDFEFIEAIDTRVPQKIYGTPVSIQDGHANFTAAIVGPILAKFEEKLGVDYALSKMDHIALVTKFTFSGMENFGLITYADYGLLLNPALSESAKFNQQGSIISLVTHEYAHQWFGDLVSPQWWQHTWLNEGFATFFANYLPDLIYPERKSMRNFFSSTIQAAFSNDDINAWSMNHYTDDPKELWTKFNRIGYQKSGCVIRMIMEVMTEPVFLKGLNYYLTENYMKAATPEELHTSLQRAYDEAFPEERLHIGDFMGTWENQAGYPLLTVKAGKDTLVFMQNRYPESKGEVYTVPITFAHKSNPEFSAKTKLWLPVATFGFTTEQTGYKEGDWLIVNIDQVGYYRVDYDKGLWRVNIEQLNNNHQVINPLNRALLIDEFYLAWTEFNRVDATDALNILNYLDKEDEYLAWARGQATYNILRNRLFGTAVYEKFAKFIRSKTMPHLEVLGYEGFDGEDPNRISLRSYTKQWSCQSLDGNCYLLEYQKLIAYLNDGGEVNFNYCHAMKLLDEPIYSQIVLGVSTNSDYANREGFVQNLGCTLNPVNLNVLLLQILNTGNILSSSERENILITMFSSSEEGLKTTLNFIDVSHGQINTMVDLSKIMSSMAEYINGKPMTAKFREVLTKLKTGQHLTEENYQSISKIIESNEKWINNNYQKVFDYFNVITPTTYRLPKDSVPISYDIILNSNIKEGDFGIEGTVNIKIEIVEDTDKITIHSSGLDITKIDVVDILSMNQIIADATFQYVKSHDFLVIYLDNTFSTGKELRLDIYYKSKLRDDGAGFYWASYNNSQGETKYYGATQFEVIDARSAFPCYDEPGIRAVMTLTIIHDKSLNAVSNTEVSTQLEDTTKTKYITQFKPTPKMQTYLLAFLVSDFQYVEATNSRIPQKIYATPMAIQDGQGNFSAGVVGSILQKLEEVLGVDYPLSKMDHAALTKFNFGAMENFGLITYIDRGLLLNPALSENSKYNQQGSIISLVTHELAHQWFGDIVSPNWWQYTWLNEGFATFFANYIPSLVYPERQSMRSFFSSTIQTAFNNDGPNAWSMNHYTEQPNELWSKFGGIGYQKSGCVIRMVMEVITEPVFLKGLNYYLTENYMKAATPEELHASLQKAYDEAFPEERLHIGDFMGTWENQAGYPLISVTVSGSNLVFSQRRYPQSSGELYTVPITFATKTNADFNNRAPKVWLPLQTLTVDQAVIGYNSNDWMIVNIDQVGYYRVDYDTVLWHANIEQLNNNHKVINPLNRALLLDEFYLGWTEFNRVNAIDALNILNYFDKEDEYLAWARGQATYNILRNRLFGTEVYENFATFIRSKTRPHLENLGYEGIDGEDPNRISLRSYTKQWSCQSLDGNCYLLEYQKLIAYSNGGGEVNFNYCYAMKLLDEPIYSQIVLGITTNSNYANRAGFVQNLGCTLNPVNLDLLLLQVVNSENILSSAERENILISMFSSSKIGLETALKFIGASYAQIKTMVDLSKIMSNMAGYINGEEMTTNFREVLDALKAGEHITEENHQSISSKLESNEAWNRENYQRIFNYLDVNYPTTYRLPKNSIPISYDIILNPNIKEGDFSLEGTVNIKIQIVEDTDKITIHSSGLDVTKIDVVDILSMNQIVSDATFQHVKSHDFLVIYLDNTYSIGTELRLDIYYKGKLRDDSAGFFWASYNNSQGEIKYYGATQFEVIDARSAFPCYDEPGIRAVMTLTIIHDKSLNAVSNTEVSVQSEDTTKTKYITQFKPTPKMQTYLLAFLVSDFEYVEATNSRIPQKIYATPMAIQDGQGNFSAGVVGPILQKLEEVLGVDYPLSKMDHAALTKFRFSAMENIGLITYVDQGLLVNPDLNENSKFNQENSIITLITHEYAHQWFGNIISPKWWQYTWLNEGFATFFGTFIPSLVYPERISMRNFFSYIMPTAFNSDGITAWSMNQYTEDPNRLWDKFDGIGYDKSSCIVRMIMEVMTESVFLKGLNYYLTENYMKAATPEELHASLQRAYNEAFPEQRLHIGDFMGTWENQAGYPLLTVKADKDKLVFSQRRYPQNKGEVYSIPISFAHKSNPDSSDKTPKLWLPVVSSEFTTSQTDYKEGDWLIVNIDQVGYYRVDYDTVLWRANIQQLNNNHKVINELNRALLLDEFYLAWTEFNRVNGGDALNILSYFDKEDEYLAWARGQATYNILRNRLFGTAAYEKFTEFIRSKTMPHLEVLGYEGFDGENGNRMSLRSYIKQWSCQSLDGNCIIQDYQKLIAYYNNGGEPNFNFCYAMELLDESIFAEIVHNATTQNDYPYREGFVRNLGCSRNPVNLNILQEQVLNVENNLSKDERQNILITMFSSSEVGLAMAINFIESNHIQLSSSVDLSMVMNVMSAYINGEEKTEKFRSIAESLKSRQVLSEEHDQSIKNTLDANEKWIKGNYYEIALFFGLIEPSTTLPPTSSTTTTTPGYISSSTTSKPQDPTTTSQRPTDPPTTTPDSGNSLFISIGLIIICTVMNSMRLF